MCTCMPLHSGTECVQVSDILGCHLSGLGGWVRVRSSHQLCEGCSESLLGDHLYLGTSYGPGTETFYRHEP